MNTRMALLLGVVLACAPAQAQMSPPSGNLTLPPARGAAPDAAPARPAPAPIAVPRAPVQQVAPMASPPLPQTTSRSALGSSAPGGSATGKPAPVRKPPVVAPKPHAGAQKPPAAKPGVAKSGVAKSGASVAVGAGVAAGVAAGAGAAIIAKSPEAKPAPKPPEAKLAEPPAAAEPTKGAVTGQPLPRWAGILYDGVKLRVGPGQRYPVDWIYRRPDQPVRVLREFETWRLIEDHEGVKGWVHQSNLTGRRSFMVPNERTLRRSAAEDAAAVAILRPGVVGRVRGCAATEAWCEVRVGDYRGWIKREGLWGMSPGEAVGN